MKIARISVGGEPRLAGIDQERVIDLSVTAPHLPKDVGELVRLGGHAIEEALAVAGTVGEAVTFSLEEVTFLPLATNPGKIICLGLNYHDHAAETNRDVPEFPIVFLRTMSSLIGHREPIIRPVCSTQLDYEGELAVIIGATCKHVKREAALSVVAGYTVFNDATIRDYQRRTPQWTVGKNFDGTGAIGPAFVPARMVPPGAAGLAIETRLNGTTVQKANTSDMIFDVAATVEILSQCMTIEVGDIIVMGTPGGVGAARKPPLFMKAGDVVEVEIESIGILQNSVRDEQVVAVSE